MIHEARPLEKTMIPRDCLEPQVLGSAKPPRIVSEQEDAEGREIERRAGEHRTEESKGGEAETDVRSGNANWS